MTEPVRATGSCLCGGVAFKVRGPLRDIVACHCSQCRKTTGHFLPATQARTDAIDFSSDETLRWYRSSPEAERGFCGRCGGALFWRPTGGDVTSIAAGSLDPPTGLTIREHIFCDDKSDYYELSNGKPRFGGDRA